MSAQQTFMLCLDCWEFCYGIPDSNGVFQRESPSPNHLGHSVHIFGDPQDYPPPIRNILACLQAGLPVSDARIDMFSLACAVTAIQPNNGIKPQPPKSPEKKRETWQEHLKEQAEQRSSADDDALFGIGEVTF